ncbi:MAG: hypothetical protein QOF60_2089 [Actinomycetota bacterium]|jgi:hypothetical protein|nr:hypothetical protein [Actinomycetota bacterium]
MTSGLWPQVDRVGLCIHRPSGSRPEYRAVAERLRIPPGSILVAAARHIAAGQVTLTQVQLLSRYESRALVNLNVERHVELGYLEPRGQGVFAPSEAFRDAGRLILEVQSNVAAELWAGHEDLRSLSLLAAEITATAGRCASVPVPAFDAQVGDRGVLPATPAAQLLGFVTELRYLRSDLHAAALARYDLAGPRASALTRLWKGHQISDDDGARLDDRGLASRSGHGWVLTEDGRRHREDAEALTDSLTEEALRAISPQRLQSLLDGLVNLPGEDPRPTEDR